MQKFILSLSLVVAALGALWANPSTTPGADRLRLSASGRLPQVRCTPAQLIGSIQKAVDWTIDSEDFAKAAASVHGDEGLTFFEIANVVKKQSNDTAIGKKDVVDEIQEKFTDILDQKLKEAGVYEHLADGPNGGHLRFRDYRTIRIAIKDVQPHQIETIKKAYVEATAEFAKVSSEKGWTKDYFEKYKGDILGDPASHFLIGMGRTPDQASAATRVGRKNFDPNAPPLKAEGDLSGSRVGLLSYRDFVPTLLDSIGHAESARLYLADHLSAESPLLTQTPHSRGRAILSPGVREIVRQERLEKNSKSPVEARVTERIKRRFEIEITKETAEAIVKYSAEADAFSPSPIRPKGESLSDLVGGAKNGIFSGDVAGHGPRNEGGVMEGFIEATRQSGRLKTAEAKVNAALDQARHGFDRATRTLQIIQGHRETSQRKVFGRGPKTRISADDAITEVSPDMVVDGVVPQEKRHAYYEELARFQPTLHGESADIGPSAFREVYMPTEYIDPITKKTTGREIPSGERSKLIVKAEKIEKEVRSLLEFRGPNKFRLPYELNRNFLIAVEIFPNPSGGVDVRIHIAGNLGEPTLSQVRQQVETVLPAAYKKVNESNLTFRTQAVTTRFVPATPAAH